jgi:hypothetical protein
VNRPKDPSQFVVLVDINRIRINHHHCLSQLRTGLVDTDVKPIQRSQEYQLTKVTDNSRTLTLRPAKVLTRVRTSQPRDADTERSTTHKSLQLMPESPSQKAMSNSEMLPFQFAKSSDAIRTSPHKAAHIEQNRPRQ